jgi:hypothetical protein
VAAHNREVLEDDTSWANARLLIIDEVSFMSTKDVENLDKKLRCSLRKYNALLGGINTLFCEAFQQLEPASENPLYTSLHSDRKWANSINCYVQRFGLHRFKNDPEWGKFLTRIRNDSYTHHDIDTINERVVKKAKQVIHPILNDAVY